MEALTVLFMLAAVGCTAPSQVVKPASYSCSGAGGGYTIGAGDVLHIAVWQNKDLDRIVTVTPDGMVSFPLINNVHAAGQTPMQLQGTITKDLEHYITDPQVSVAVKQVRSFVVSVLGEVQHPGRYELSSNATTVLDVLAQAGGFTTYADKNKISILRQGPHGTQRTHFPYQKVVSGNSGTADFCVRPGDTVVVP